MDELRPEEEENSRCHDQEVLEDVSRRNLEASPDEQQLLVGYVGEDIVQIGDVLFQVAPELTGRQPLLEYFDGIAVVVVACFSLGQLLQQRQKHLG